MAELAPANTCVAPVYSIPEVVEDPHFKSRCVFMRAEHGEAGEKVGFDQVGPILAGGERDQATHLVRPFGETDAAELLEAVGMSRREIGELRANGIVE